MVIEADGRKGGIGSRFCRDCLASSCTPRTAGRQGASGAVWLAPSTCPCTGAVTLNLATLSPPLARQGRTRVYRNVAVPGRDGRHDVVIEGRRIVAIGAYPDGDFPPGTIEIDASGLALSPGRVGDGTIASGTTTRIVASLVPTARLDDASGEAQNVALVAPSTAGPDFARLLPTHLQRLEEWGISYRPLDGPRPAQRTPGVPGVPRTRAERERIIAELVADVRQK